MSSVSALLLLLSSLVLSVVAVVDVCLLLLSVAACLLLLLCCCRCCAVIDAVLSVCPPADLGGARGYAEEEFLSGARGFPVHHSRLLSAAVRLSVRIALLSFIKKGKKRRLRRRQTKVVRVDTMRDTCHAKRKEKELKVDTIHYCVKS